MCIIWTRFPFPIVVVVGAVIIAVKHEYRDNEKPPRSTVVQGETCDGYDVKVVKVYDVNSNYLHSYLATGRR